MANEKQIREAVDLLGASTDMKNKADASQKEAVEKLKNLIGKDKWKRLKGGEEFFGDQYSTVVVVSVSESCDPKKVRKLLPNDKQWYSVITVNKDALSKVLIPSQVRKCLTGLKTIKRYFQKPKRMS